eukprot:7705321-Prorocentrum_lima.AAC.1
MAHTGQIDGLPRDDSEEQDNEPSNRQYIHMMKGLISMVQQHLRQINDPPQSRKGVVVSQDDPYVRT